MSSNDKQVYISYAWGGESERIANELDADLQANGVTIVRDKRDLGFKGMIRDFMQQIGRGHAVIVIISDKYLKSPNCMYELVEIAKNKDVHNRIFPIVLGDADIYNPVNRIKYIKHWEDKLKELDEAMRSVSAANLQGMRDEIDSYDEIRDNVSNLTFLLKDMNTLTPEMHEGSNFTALISSLKQRLGETGGAEQPAVKKPASKASSAAATTTKAGSTSEYLGDLAKRLTRDDYKELTDESYGDLNFQFTYERTIKYLFNTLNEFHRFVILTENGLTEDRFLELHKELRRYTKNLGDKRASYSHVVGVIATEAVSDSLRKLIHDIEPFTYTESTDWGAYTTVVYSEAENKIIYPKDITEYFDSKFSDKIENYLKP